MQQMPSQPWWKFGHVWLVISGPLVVVIASVITFFIATRMPDPVLKADMQGSFQADGKSAEAVGGSLAPAQQARNHAATGVPVPAEKR